MKVKFQVGWGIAPNTDLRTDITTHILKVILSVDTLVVSAFTCRAHGCKIKQHLLEVIDITVHIDRCTVMSENVPIIIVLKSITECKTKL